MTEKVNKSHEKEKREKDKCGENEKGEVERQ